MKVRKRVVILGAGNKKIKPSLFFMAGQMGLSGWIVNMNSAVLEAELQGDERNVNSYVNKVFADYGLDRWTIRSEMVDTDLGDDGSLKIG